jgi:hypothetical protein
MQVCVKIDHVTSQKGTASWSSGQSFCLLIMRSWVRFPVLPWGFFLEGEDPHGDHGLGSLVELRFKAPPGTSYSCITIHLMGVLNLEVCYTSATTGRGDHEVHKGHLVALGKEKKSQKGVSLLIRTVGCR